MSKIEEALEKATRRRQGLPAESPAPGAAGQLDSGATEPCRVVEEVELDQLHLVENRLVVASSPSLGASDAYRQLRVSLMLAAEQQKVSFVVTSALQADGKSLTCLNLGFAIAHEISLDTVVIDADLRRPSLSSFLGIAPHVGLGEYLTDPSLTIEDAIMRITDGPLFVPAGRIRLRNTSELLGSDRMRQFSEELRRLFPGAIILYDSPPVLPAPDAMALVQWVDGAIFVVRAGKTSRKALTDSVRQFGANRIVGVVVNHSDRGFGYGYNYRYYYAYRDGAETTDGETPPTSQA
jgi:capsular exopolysaccharide synthesis family protein